ncbi:Type-2 restriction enzyme BstVI [Candidatus Desulfarcum epimagneticum]|uniref:Type-2 restriction enzyme BstVI n=1 Tax=uncultured Desulfobacteraceae bacterium TaxID=218296 RepID=A0A484HKC1_9BACT|nr:Type-2 restriction enzyme BstVI [uncultured Desulfobacteraceae bacterium]
MPKIIDDIDPHVAKAVSHYWLSRKAQKDRQEKRGAPDAGLRSAVTGGAQMDGFIQLFKNLIVEGGIDERRVFEKKALQLPGFFRPTKEWDLLVVKNGRLIVAIEAKSQVGPSFGNNFNNRTEEAVGSALDLWTAFREGAFNGGLQPFVGYFFMIEDCQASNRPVKVKEPHFKVFPEFVGASYMKRYELFCRKLILERHYTSSSFIASSSDSGVRGVYHEPAKDLSFKRFASALVSHAGAFV